jgi:hypothetical protein
MRENPLSWMRGWHRQNGAIEGGNVQNVKRAHMREGATEPGHPFLEPEEDATPKPWRWTIHPTGRPQAREEGEERDHSRGGSLYSKEATTSGGWRRGLATTLPEENEDTVSSVTMINGAMPSTLMGQSSHLSMGCKWSWDVITTSKVSIYHLVFKMLSFLRLATMPCWEYISHFSLRTLQYAMIIIGLVTNTSA